MQRYTRIILIILCLISSLAFRSEAQVLQWSNPTKLKGSAIFTKVIGENEKGVFLLRYRNKFFTRSVIIEKYAHQLSFVDARSIDLKHSRLVRLNLTQKGILVIISKFSRKKQSNTLLGQYYDFDLKPIGEPVIMYEEPVQEFGNRGSYRIRLSDDQKHIAILSTGESRENTVVLNWALFDSDFKLLREKSIELPYVPDDFVIWDFIVNDEGCISALSKNRVELSRKMYRFGYNLFVWNQDTLFDHALTDTIDIKEISLSFNRNTNEALVSGLFGKPQIYGLNGVFTYRLDLSDLQVSESITYFNDELIAELKVSADHSKEVVPEGFVYIDLVPRSDGGYLLIAEQKDITTESDIIMVNGIPQSTSKNIYNFNDIIVMNIDSSGKLNWSHVVHKNQTTMNDGGYFSSVVVYVSDNFIQLIYNDQIRNSGDVMQYTIYSNGKVMSRKLLKSELDFVVVIPPEAEQVSSNKIIIPTSKNRRFALLKLVYD